MNDGRAAVAFIRLLRVFLCQFEEKYYFCRWGSYIMRNEKLQITNYKLEMRNEKYEKTGSYQGYRF